MKTEIYIPTEVRKQALFAETNIVENAFSAAREAVRKVTEVRNAALGAVARYYGGILGEELSPRKAGRIVNAQVAFLVLITFSGASLPVLLACVAWFVSALMGCRE